MRLHLAALAVTGAFVALAPAIASADAARDARRTSYIEGLTCNTVWRGQPAEIRYRTKGRGKFGVQESFVTFGWKVQDDQFCITAEGGDETCSPPPKTEGPKDKETI